MNVMDNNLSILLANNKALHDRQEAKRLHQEHQCAQQEREAADRKKSCQGDEDPSEAEAEG